VSRSVLAELLAVLAPPMCAACREPVARSELRLCPECARALPWLPARPCRRCGLPGHRRGCLARGAAFGRAWAPMAYDGVARELVAALKFRGALPVASVMAAHMAANLPPDLRALVAAGPSGVGRDEADGPALNPSPGPGGTAVIAVPPQPARARRRGFDPAGVLAAELARRLGVPERSGLQRRDREGRQVGATRAQRRRTGRLHIELCGPPPRRALLVDDVHTTGATLDACARALVAGGCQEVIALTYARTL
jgi:predicted amidophosphoribosyltransferase